MHDIYRDPTEGAVAKRHDLLGRRRDELATMPHAIRRVVVTRWARIAASIAAWIGGEVMVIAAVAPSFARWVSGALPGQEPAPLSTLLVGAWVLGLVAYWIARSAAEHRFAVAMSRTVLPGQDVFDDIERLDHVHPDDEARGMAHRLEVLSAALPVVAVSTLVPATAAYVAMGVVRHGWPSERAYEAWLFDHSSELACLALAGVGACVIMTKRWARVPAAITWARVLTVGCAAAAFAQWWMIGPAALAAAAAIIGKKLVKERAQIQAEDPAAGSEVFTLRGAIASVRDTAGQVKTFVRAHRRGALVAAGAVLLALGVRVALRDQGRTVWVEPAPGAKAALELPGVPPLVAPERAPAYVQIDPAACRDLPFARGSCLRVEINFHDHHPVKLPTVFPGMAVIPTGWDAQLAVQLGRDSQDATVSAFAAAPGGGVERRLDGGHSLGTAAAHACGADVPPASMWVAPDPRGPAEQRVVLYVNATLELASCRS